MRKSFLKRLTAITLGVAVLGTCTNLRPFMSEPKVVSAADSEVEKNYAKLLQYSMYFYDANMCGTGVNDNNRYKWRSNCHTYDAQLPLDSKNTNMTDSFIKENIAALDSDGDGCVDVSGGFHDAGDHVKFGMPEAYSGSTLGWGYYEFKDEYVETEQDDHIETILRYFNDYFMRCTFRDDNGDVVAFCYQVGDGDIDHAYWNAPEADEMFRRGWFATKDMPSTDCVSAAAASLAVNYMNFKEEDPEYAEKNLDYAEALFRFAESCDEKSCNDDGPKVYYSSSKWIDDYCWASIWLYLCTQNKHYLDIVLENTDYYAGSCWTHCWNDVWAGTMYMLAEVEDMYGQDGSMMKQFLEAQGKTEYEKCNFWNAAGDLPRKWKSGSVAALSPTGYAFLSVWGSARYNTATQLAALIYDKHHGDKAGEYSEWAKSQMDYLIGENPLNRCYVVGYSDNSVKYPHHRAASGLSKCEDPGEHRYVLYGALVGGPDAKDEHNDITSDWIYNEVTIDYNAAFVGACAGLYHFYKDDTMKITPDFPPDPVTPEQGPESYWVNAFSVEIVQTDGPKTSEITFYVSGNVAKPSKNTSVRYFFDATGMSSVDPSNMTVEELYDQAYEETDGHDGVISGPHHYKDNIYYVEVTWDGYAIANSNKKYQFAVGTYAWKNSWNTEDDWSHKGIRLEENPFLGTVERTDYICVYNDGVLVGGIEPDGSVPVVNETAVTTATEKTTTTKISQKPVTTAKTTTSKKYPTEPDKLAPGDVNGDKKVDISDLTLLSLYFLEDVMFNDKQIAAGDVNASGEADLADMAHLKQYIMKDPVKLGAQ